MTIDATPVPDTHRDLLTAAGVAILTTLGADRYPQSTAVWYLYEDGVVRVSVERSRQKYHNLERHPQATLFLLDPENPFRTLELRSEVTLTDDPDRAFVRRVFSRYGQDPDTSQVPTHDRVIITLTPRHVVAR